MYVNKEVWKTLRLGLGRADAKNGPYGLIRAATVLVIGAPKSRAGCDKSGQAGGDEQKVKFEVLQGCINRVEKAKR